MAYAAMTRRLGDLTLYNVDLALLVFRLAEAGVEDATTLLSIEKRVGVSRIYEPRVTLADALKEIAENSLYFITLADKPIGTASFRQHADGTVYIGNVSVDPQYRNNGVARAAMTFLLNKTKHATRLELVTHPDNNPALNLYHSLGFTLEATIGNYFGDGEPRVRLVRVSAPPNPTGN
jgi:ribosomal protein S18 acetylase RimI-like enzyme